MYERIADKYDPFFGPIDRLGFSRWRSRAVAELNAANRILEIGTGTGRNFAHFAQGQYVIGIDNSVEMLKVAQRRGRRRLVQADAQRLPFADDSFDAALATLVFCTVTEPRFAFAELIRVIRPEGRVVLLEHVRPPRLLGYAFDLLNAVTTRTIHDDFNRRTVDTARSSGIEILRVERKFGGAVNLIVGCVNK